MTVAVLKLWNGYFVTDPYRLNPDCTGTITTIFPNGTSGQGADFVVAEGGKKIHAIGVTVAGPGNITTITFTKVPV